MKGERTRRRRRRREKREEMIYICCNINVTQVDKPKGKILRVEEKRGCALIFHESINIRGGIRSYGRHVRALSGVCLFQCE